MPKKRLKIGVVVDQLLPGGVQITAIKEVEELRREGHRAELLILMRKKYSFRYNFLVHHLPHRFLSDDYPWPFRNTIKFPVFTFFSTLHLLSPLFAPRVIKTGDYDLLISHGTTTCFTTLSLWRKRKIPYLAMVHDPMIFILQKVYSATPLRFTFPLTIPLASYLENQFIREALATVIESQVHYSYIQKNYHIKPVIIPLGSQALDRLPPKRGPWLLAVSRWQKEKNPHLLLEILQAIPEARLRLAGSWTNSSDLKIFQEKIRTLGLSKRVEVLPQFTDQDRQRLFAEARVLVHPHFEAFGLGGLEAASHGCPMIIPAGSGVTDLFQDGIHGFFPKKPTLGQYLPVIKKLLNDPDLAYRMGQNAHHRVQNEYSWKNHTQKIISLARQQLEKRQRKPIVALEIGHAGGTGLSGGDRLWEEMVKRFPPKKYDLEVITSSYGSYHWRQAHLDVKITGLPPNPFEDRAGPIAVFLSYLIRIGQTIRLLWRVKTDFCLYSSTNIFPDVLAAFLLKIHHSSHIWIARIHHLIPPPHQREGRLLVNTVSYILQTVALFCLETKADLVIALNTTLYRRLRFLGFSPRRLTTLGAGIDLKFISHFPRAFAYQYDGVYLGRLHVAKGVFDTIPIWQEVVKRLPRAKLAVIGGGPDYIKKALRAKIRQNHLGEQITILGYLPPEKLYSCLKSAKVFLFTDHEAGWGLAIAEAMACGLPAVGYDIGILGDIYKGGYRVVPLGNTSAFSQEVLSLLCHPLKRNKLARKAKKEAEKLDWRYPVEKFQKLTDNLFKKSPFRR